MLNPLELPEICFAICQECRPRELCNLAVASKYWNSIAEVLLWESIPGLVCLLRLMPETAWEAYVLKPQGVYFLQHRRVFKFRRPLTPDDWDPVLRRASYVRVLDQTALGRRRVSYFQDVIDAIAVCPPPRKLCPELRRLDMRASAFFSATPNHHLSAILLPPTLTSLTITLDIDGRVPADCRALAAACPNLRTLVIREHDTDTERLRALLRAFHLHPRLESVALHTYEPADALGVIAQLPALQRLAMQIRARGAPALGGEGRLFAALTSLTLEGASFAMVCAMMRAWGRRPMRALELDAVTYEAPDDLRCLMCHVRDHCEAGALRRLIVNGHNPFEIAGGRAVMMQDFDPLPALPNLVYFHISVPFIDVMSDSDWAHLVPRFPILEYFDLRFEEDGGGDYDEEARTSTLATLLHFARGCRRLRHLYVPIGRMFVPPNFTGALESPQVALTSLDVQWATAVDDTKAVVSFLSAVFPELEQLATSCSWVRHGALGVDDEDFDEPWSSLRKGLREDWERRHCDTPVIATDPMLL